MFCFVLNSNSQNLVPNWSFEDTIGKIVYENKLLVTNALTNFNIDVKSGVYFVKIHDSSLNKTLIKKLVVQQ